MHEAEKQIPMTRLMFFLTFGLIAFPAAALSQEDVWELQKSGVAASLRGLCAVSETCCWASGAKGTVLIGLGGADVKSVAVHQAAVLMTTDSGQECQNVTLPIRASQSAGVFSITARAMLMGCSNCWMNATAPARPSWS